MVRQNRTIRYSPTELPFAEKFDNLSRLIDAVWFLAEELNIDIGRKPTQLNGKMPFNPPRVLEAMTVLGIELLSTSNSLGLHDALHTAILKYTEPKGKLNFSTIIDDTYTGEDPFTD